MMYGSGSSDFPVLVSVVAIPSSTSHAFPTSTHAVSRRFPETWTPPRPCCLPYLSDSGGKPLNCSSSFGPALTDASTISLLLPQLPYLEPGSTALHVACQRVHLRCIRLLTSAGADRSVLDDRGFTPIDVLHEFPGTGEDDSLGQEAEARATRATDEDGDVQPDAEDAVLAPEALGAPGAAPAGPTGKPLVDCHF